MQNGSERVEPRTAAEAGAMLLEAAQAGRTVSLDRLGGEIVVSTVAMTRVIEHEATDLTCIVEPGLRLSQLDAALAPHGQRLALDPPGDPTVGEVILDGLFGPRRHRYGAVRDLILGVTVALVDGTVASSGGKVVKNVAGYDLAKLFCGSRGRLGLVVRAALRLHPRSERTVSAGLSLDEPRAARDAVRALQRSTLVPSALELLWPDRLLVMLEGSAPVVAAQLAEAERVVGASEIHGDPWPEARESQARAGGALAFAPGELEDVLRAESRALVRPSLGIAYVERHVGSETSLALRALNERVRRAFDPEEVLVG
jgi:glycolate oxidase FAD binding subunit